MNVEIQKHLAEEYKKNAATFIPEVSIICEAISNNKYQYNDVLLDGFKIDESKEFVEQIIIPFRHVKNSKSLDVAYDSFMSEIFELDDDYRKSIENEYLKKGEKPKYVNVTGLQIPVMYKHKDLPYERQVDLIIEDAIDLYELIEENLLEAKKEKTFSKEKEEKAVEKIKLDFYKKRKKELAGVAAGIALFGIASFFGGNKENKETAKELSQNNIENLKSYEKTERAEKTIHFADVQKEEVKNAEKTEQVEKKSKEVRAKLADKKEAKKQGEAQAEKPETSKRNDVKIEQIKITPLSVPEVKVAEITLQNIPAHLEMNKQNRFKKIVKETFAKEGGYGTTEKEAKALREKGEKVAVIDQPTNFGVTNPLLKSLKEQFPEKYGDFPKDVKNLTEAQSVKVVEYFYEQFCSHKIENESVAKMLFDASYNHTPKTFKKFTESGIKEVEKTRDEKVSKKSIKNWTGKVDYLNACSNKELNIFYNKFAEERLAFMKDGRVDKFKGIITRAEGYIGGFEVDKSLTQAIAVSHAEKIVENNYGISAKTFAMFAQKGKINS